MAHSHSICVLQDNYATLYGKVSAYLSKGYAVIYAVESSPITDTVQRMNNMGIRTENYIQDSSLTVLDRNYAYSQAETNFEGRLLLERWKTIISEAIQKAKFKGLAVMGMPEPFFETANHQKLVEYEELVCREFDGSLDAICCYRQRSVADLPLKHLVPLLHSHQYALTGIEEYSKWHAAKLFVPIIKGLEKTLGKPTAELTFEAMKSIHKVDERTAIFKPAAFENAIRKMFGHSADIIIDAIKGEIIRDISYAPNHSESYDIGRAFTGLKFLLCPACYWSATAIFNRKPDVCPACGHSVINSASLNSTKLSDACGPGN